MKVVWPAFKVVNTHDYSREMFTQIIKLMPPVPYKYADKVSAYCKTRRGPAMQRVTVRKKRGYERLQ